MQGSNRTFIRRRSTGGLGAAALIAATAVLVAAAPAGARTIPMAPTATTTVVVPRGQPVQFALTVDTTHDPLIAEVSPSLENAVQMAVGQHPTIRGFRVRVNNVETDCGGDNTLSATAIVSNTQNTAVLGNICSSGMVSALPIYQAAGVVTISGSATGSFLPALGPTVFNRTAVVSDAVGDPGDNWLSQVATLPSVSEWEQEFEAEFGTAPFLEPFPVLYFDAASLVLSDLQKVSKIVNGNLVINRAALASAVRNTTNFQGVSCTITLDPVTGNRVNDLAGCAQN
jgi:ABC-type branched-subunit amino acid transport system substrate-binding protein